MPLRHWWHRPAAPLIAIAIAQLAIHLAANGRYGFQTDELYYIASGRHPAFGYVDYPPVTPMLALLNTSIFGVAPWTLRLFPALTSAAIVFLVGMCAREMGGGRRASILASVVALLSPYLLATWLFQTVEFDQLAWVIAVYLLLRILRTGDGRLLLLLGLDLGAGFETKTTILALCAGIVVAVLMSRELRPLLRTRYPWIALAIAAALAVPNVAWQIANSFPTLTYIHNHSGDISQNGGVAAFVALFFLEMGPLLLPLWIAGMVFVFRTARLRPVGVVTVVAILLLLPEGKAYYPAPTIPIIFAAGCVAAEGIVSRTRRSWVTRLVVVGGLIEAVLLSPIILPLVPASSMHSQKIDTLNPDFANTVGWPELASQVGAVYHALPAAQRATTAIIMDIAGAAAAIDIYGGAEHLPQALSPQLSAWYWKPADLGATTLVTVGYSPGDLAFLCGTTTRAAIVHIPYSIDNLEQGAPVLVCTDLRESLDAAWASLRNFS